MWISSAQFEKGSSSLVATRDITALIRTLALLFVIVKRKWSLTGE
ncbi:MAG TPA: hypothetical protein VE445_10555 [Nitrososphaeraceae archaeon]|nr:hypothetical protein [Nitrososphaeraceae archaeon]